MTESSAEYFRLECALAEAGGLLSDLPPHNIVNRIHELKLRSYVLLCHAAIEEYLERVSIAVLRESLEAFRADGKVRDPLVCACSYYKINVSQEVSSRRNGDSFRDILLALSARAIEEHDVALEGIYGIKTKDQDAILLPIGIKLFDFDRLLSQNLNSFGVTRGSFAHRFGLKHIVPRAGVESTVRGIFGLLQNLDNFLCERYRFSFDLT